LFFIRLAGGFFLEETKFLETQANDESSKKMPQPESKKENEKQKQTLSPFHTPDLSPLDSQLDPVNSSFD